MADIEDGAIFWYSPEVRAIFDLDKINFDKSTLKKIKKGTFSFSINKDFDFVIRSCSNRSNTWISEEIIDIYTELHNMGYAHSVEVWSEGSICGGLYGVAIGGAFFGESMFNLISDAAKAAFYFLAAHLKYQGFILLDSQYINPFTKQLGAFEIPKQEYLELLEEAIELDRTFV